MSKNPRNPSAPRSTTGSTSKPRSQGKSFGKPQGKPEAKPYGKPQGKPLGKAKGRSLGRIQRESEEGFESNSRGEPLGKPQGKSYGKPSARPARKPYGKPSAKPQSTPADKALAEASDASLSGRIAKVLARVGVASRREAERMVEAGRVSVNGERLSSPALNVTPTDRILVDGKPIAAPEPERLWLYYKPNGLVSTDSDEKGRETIFDHLPDTLPRVMTVGRLDLNSEGLLLLTNDGSVKRKLELPSTGWLRKYRVRVNGRPTENTFAPLRNGIVVEGERFQPMEITLDRQQGANAWITVGLREGKNREIRRAMDTIGLNVNRLIRISYGPFQLGTLKPGEVEEIRRRVVRDQLGLDGAVAPDDRPKPTRTRR